MIKSANLSFSLLMWIVSSIVVVLLAPTGLSDSNAGSPNLMLLDCQKYLELYYIH